MTITRCKIGDVMPLTPEEIAHLNSLADLRDEDIDCSDPDDYEATDEELACGVSMYDYPTEEESSREIRHLMEMRKSGMSLDEIEAYKKSRVSQLATV
jgi:hypothetical protein